MPEFIKSTISQPQIEGAILPPGLEKKITAVKNYLPRNKLVHRADAAEKLNVLIAHYVDHLRPQQQAGDQQNDDQNDTR